MIYVIAFVFIGFSAILWYSYRSHRKKALINRMAIAVDMVKMGVYGRLSQRLKDQYGREEGILLAGAVVNEIFSGLPTRAEAKEFAASNKEVIERELSNLKNEDEIRKIITQAVRVKIIITVAQGIRNRQEIVEPLEKLERLGLLVPGGEAPTPESFLSQAREFLEATPRGTENRDE